MNTSERPKLIAPYSAAKILLHFCCAPCEGEVLETLYLESNNRAFSIQIFIRKRNTKSASKKIFLRKTKC